MTSHHDVAGVVAECLRPDGFLPVDIETTAKLMQAVQYVEALATQLSDALLKVRPLGGSELFIKRNGKYYADPKYCGDAIEERSAAYHEAMKESVRERKRALAAEARLVELSRAMTEVRDWLILAGDMTCREIPLGIIARTNAAKEKT